MNNPMQQANFMARGSPPTPGGGGGPPIAKKQRGGRTPASIRRHVQGLTTMTTTAPATATAPPPGRFAPSASTTTTTTEVVDDAIARRRAELRRLQEKSKADRAAALQRKNTHRNTTGIAPAPGNTSTVPPMRPAGVGRHHSDLFPSVQPKSPSIAKSILPHDEEEYEEEEEHAQIEAFAHAATFHNKGSSAGTSTSTAIAAIPGVVMAAAAAAENSTTTNPNLLPETPLGNGLIPPTPAIGRRLEFPSTQKHQQQQQQQQQVPGPPRRDRSKSPSPTKSVRSAGTSTTGSTNSADTRVKAAAALAERRRRARSAPPVRPPPPPARPPPAAPHTTMKSEARSRGTTTEAAEPRVNTTEWEPTTATGTTLAANHPVLEGAATELDGLQEPVPVVQAPPPPTRVSSLAYGNDPSKMDDNSDANPPGMVGLGTIDTSKLQHAQYPSKIPSPISSARKQSRTTVTTTSTATTGVATMLPPLLMTTPVAQRETFLGDGQKTPPSTGSSTRRHKLKLMTEQALAASSLKSSGGTASVGAGVGAGPPATAAFAAAIGMTTTTTTNGLKIVPDLIRKVPAGATGLPPPGHTSSFAPRGANLPPYGKRALSASSATEHDSATTADTTSDPTTTTYSPLPPLRNESQARLEEAYTRSERDKTAALRKIKDLEDRLNANAKDGIARTKENKPLIVGGLDTIVDELLIMAKSNGPTAALDWIEAMKEQFQSSSSPASPSRNNPSLPLKSASRVGFDTGIMGVGRTPPRKSTIDGGFMMSSTPIRQRIASRNLTPHPTKHHRGDAGPNFMNNGDDDNEEHPEDMEKRLHQQFREAVQYVPYEFSSEIANYTVRCPYGIDLETKAELFEYVKPPQQPLDAYSRVAHVSAKSSIEVVAIIKADNSPLLLFGTAGVRYNTNHNSNEWTHINNVDTDLDRPLGYITYIDENAMEREYSLDEILEEALLVREQYCGTVTSTALGFDGRGPVQAEQRPLQQVQIPGSIEKAPSRDIAVETDERGIGTDAPPPSQYQEEQGGSPSTGEKIADDQGASSDVLIVFIGMMGTLLLKLLLGIVIGIPLRIVRALIVFTAAYIIIQIVHMHYADGYNQWLLHLYNDPAIPSTSFVLTDLVYYTNREPGVM